MSDVVGKGNVSALLNEDKNTAVDRTIVSPAYFLSLTVENFRCFKPTQTLDLSDGERQPARWTLILGENGVGKTSLLQLLALMQPEEARYASYAPNNQVNYVPKIFENAHKLDLFREKDIVISQKRMYEEGLSKTNCSISSGWTFNGPTTMNLVEYEATFNQTGWFCSSVYSEPQALVCYGYGASRRMGTTSLSDLRNEDSSASLFADTVELMNAEEWLLQADYAVSRAKGAESKRAENQYNRVKKILTELLPDVDDLRISASASLRMGPHVQAQTPYGWVPIQSLSLGYRTLLTWMVDLAARLFERYPHSKNPLAEPAVVLVDEIDLHLHPQWQRKLIQFLSDTFPNTQFIATAHSPLVVQAASDANLVLLQREGDHVVINNDVETIEGWRADQILTSDLFGLDSARPPQLDAALRERERLLSKSRLTKTDKKRIEELERQIGSMPTGETPQDIKAMDIIRRAASLLEQNGRFK